MGDININTLNDHANGINYFNNMCDTFDLINLIKTNTCFTKTSSSSLDVILTNKPKSFVHTSTIETGISDCHTVIATMSRAHVTRLNPIKIHYRSYKSFNPFVFIDEIKNMANEELNGNADEMYDNFVTKFDHILSKHAPVKSKLLRGNHKPFITVDQSKAIKTRSRLKTKFIKNKTDENWQAYKRQRNKCTSLK